MQTNKRRRVNLGPLVFLATVALLAIGVSEMAAQNPGPRGSTFLDPAVARKAKWPTKNADGTIPGYTGKGNSFYKKDKDGKTVPGTDLYNFAALTGHFTNYDENDIPPYTLPDPLTMQDGRRVTSSEMWFKERRPELVKLFQTEIYGRVPEEKLPKIVWEVTSNVNDGKTIKKTIVGRFEDTPKGAPGAAGGGGKGGKGGNTITITLTLPVVGHPVPIFSGGAVDNAAAHGWGTFSVSGNAGVLSRINPAQGQDKPGDFPGNYAVTAWAFSRAIDYLVTDKDVDARFIIIAGISTGGKQVLLTAAMDRRIFCVIPQSSGAMGVKLNRRDVGETVDNLAKGTAGNYCPNFQKWVGRWADMPTDQHEMIAMMAPRKMFITGGIQELWQDVRGGFLASVAAEPVYNLLGKRGVGAIEMPPIEMPNNFGEIGFYHHNGGHTFTPNERRWVTSWMEKILPGAEAEKGK